MATTKKNSEIKDETKKPQKNKTKKIATTNEKVEEKATSSKKKTSNETKESPATKKVEKKETVKKPVKNEETITKTKSKKQEKADKNVKAEKDKNVEKAKADLEKTTVFVTEEFQKDKKEIDKIAKKQHRKEIFKEIRAFFILVICIGLVCFGVWYWYTHFYNPEPKREQSYEKVENQLAEYKIIKYSLMNDEDYLEVLNEKYLIERDDEKIYKIMDLKGNVLFEGTEEFDYIYEGIDNNIYAYSIAGVSYENIIELYKLNEEKFEKVNTITEKNVVYNALVYKDELGYEKLLGFKGLYTAYDEELQPIVETKVYKIEDKELILKDYYLVGDNETKSSNEATITYDSQYVIIYENTNGKKNYGLYDIKSEKIIIKPQYEALYTDGINYIATKNGKTGIISSKLKKIVDFQYDFIDRQENYYVVSKNKKLAIMDEDYRLLTGFTYDYQESNKELSYTYSQSKNSYNTFKTSRIGDKYILTINNNEEQGLTYPKHETYIIDKNGTYETISANQFDASINNSLIYSYNYENQEYTIYDQNIKELYKIDLSEYDYNNYPKIELINENTIAVHMNSDIYYNYETGEEIEYPLNYQTSINGITISYDNQKNNVTYKVNGEEVATITVNINENNKYFNKINDNIIYYNTKKDYIYIEKGE